VLRHSFISLSFWRLLLFTTVPEPGFDKDDNDYGYVITYQFHGFMPLSSVEIRPCMAMLSHATSTGSIFPSINARRAYVGKNIAFPLQDKIDRHCK
jgi:hypothetical protein